MKPSGDRWVPIYLTVIALSAADWLLKLAQRLFH